ncbi:hypothetical protein KY345_02925 [Candidatus Woesearchaeota archaeon]|nr:hypothetical protein [Candidatus Woesearchaeota archaeon]
MFKEQHDRLLKKAEQYHFSTGVEDACTKIAKANMKFGLAKLHWVQHSLGLEPNATFISSPDETITRNVARWEQGISYGGKITWGNGKEKLMILDVKPNACGMLVGGLGHIPEPRDIIRRTENMEHEKHYINDIKVKWDFYKGNHFIDFFEVKPLRNVKVPKYAVILHAGCPEFKGENYHGTGLYWNQSNLLQQIMVEVQTPFGKLRLLEGEDALEYYRHFRVAEDFAKKRRELAYRLLMDGRNVITNKTHQGLTSINEIMLGCHNIRLKNDIFPISIRADLPSYLFRGKFNLTKDKIEELGFTQRSIELGVYKRLRKANIMPHGGGYRFLDSLAVDKVFEVGNRRFFEIDMIGGLGKKIVSDMNELQFAYRSREVVQKTIELEMGEPIVELRPVYTLKI